MRWLHNDSTVATTAATSAILSSMSGERKEDVHKYKWSVVPSGMQPLCGHGGSTAATEAIRTIRVLKPLRTEGVLKWQ